LSKARNIALKYLIINSISSKYIMFPDDDSSFDSLFFLKGNKFKVVGLVLKSFSSFAVMLTNFYTPGNYPYYVPYRTIYSK